MKFSELKAKIESGEKFSDILEVKSIASFMDKRLIVDTVVSGVLETDENGMMYCDFMIKELLTKLKIANVYGGIEFEDNVVEEYDYICENGVLDFILKDITFGELTLLNDVIDKEIEQKIKLNNSIEGIVNSNLQKLIDKLPNSKELDKLMKTASKELQKFDPQKYSQIQEMMKVVK